MKKKAVFIMVTHRHKGINKDINNAVDILLGEISELKEGQSKLASMYSSVLATNNRLVSTLSTRVKSWK